ncbi:MAG: hypothetical protein WC352_01220 [Candidatus Omnitrophota bacterium]|jgi:hypothetical protein
MAKQFAGLAALLVVFLLNGQLLAETAGVALAEADVNFTYQGKPIHPKLVQEFSSWISDKGLPTTITVDVSAPHRNEYSDEISMKGKNVCVYPTDNEGKQTGESFSYERLGKLNNGLHVLRVMDGGGGSGVFTDLFFVRFSKGTGLTPEGSQYDQLLMSIVRQYPVGDRDDGEIKVLGDRVVVGRSRYRDKDVILTF